MQLLIRPAVMEELPALSALCMRSKAVWAYDAAFLEACRAELTLRPGDLTASRVVVAEQDRQILGVAQVRASGPNADLQKLFVDPQFLRGGVGRALLVWAIGTARDIGAACLIIEADPDAAPFYRRMGARDAGLSPSGSIPGRMLPKLELLL